MKQNQLFSNAGNFATSYALFESLDYSETNIEKVSELIKNFHNVKLELQYIDNLLDKYKIL